MEKKITNKKEIPVFFAVDDNYIPVLSVAIRSMLDNASKSYNYAIKILNTGIKEESRQRFQEFNSENVKVEFVDVSRPMIALSDKLHTRDYFSKTTYFRLFIPKMFPQYNKCLYLDADIIVNGDISKLYNTFLGGNLIGATTDEAVQLIPEFVDYVENALGIAGPKYFNAGILVMNLKQLREYNFEEKFVRLLSKYTFRVAQDQDYLNVICKDRVTYINGNWNKMPFKNGCLDTNKLNLVHYNLSAKPWHVDNILFEELFWDYAKKSSYYQDIVNIKANYSEEAIKRDAEGGARLIKLAADEAKDANNYYNLFVKNASGDEDEDFDPAYDTQPANT